MKRLNKFMLKACLTLSALTLSTQAENIGKKAYEKACLACHGADGIGNNAPNMAPNITLLKNSYAKTQFHSIIKGERKGIGSMTMMSVVKAMNLNDEELNDALDYALKLPEKASLHSNLKGDTKKGESHYQACIHCHGKDAMGYSNPGLPAPRLAGQIDQYILTSLKNFKAAHRGPESPAAAQMQAMIAGLKDEQSLHDISAYIRTLDPNYNNDLSQVSYKIYSGKWSKMPDFSKLEVIKSGTIPTGQLPDIRLAEADKNYAIVFEGQLRVPKTGKYEFVLASDDGSMLYLNNKKILDNDGLHSHTSTKKAKIQLKAGMMPFKLSFFQQGGGQALLLSWKSRKDKSFRALTKDPLHKKGSAPKNSIPVVQKGTEATLLRNFFSDSDSRSIAVAYPDEMNLIYDASNMALAHIWKGQFVDAGDMWNGRGTKYIFPSATAIKIQRNSQVAKLTDNKAPWPTDIDKKASEFKADKSIRFKGYELDKNRFPSFLYHAHQAQFKDKFSPLTDATGFKRSISIAGDKSQLYFRVCLDLIQQKSDDTYLIDDRYLVKVSHAKLRQYGQAQELIIPLEGKKSIEIQYLLQENN